MSSGRRAPWNGVAGPAHSDDGIDAATFRKPLLASAPQSLEAPRVASFVLRDSSLLGRLRDMEQRMTCAELRAALRVASNDGALIVETMKQRGCQI